MTLDELAKEYRATDEIIKQHITILRQELKKAPRNAKLKDELRILGSMHRDMEDSAIMCEHYYDRGFNPCKTLYNRFRI